MPLTYLASFKNSRVYGRKATTSAETLAANAAVAPAVTVLAVADPNRTYLQVRNLHATDSLRYGYATGGVAPTAAFLLANGQELRAGEVDNDLEDPEAVYAVSETANPIPVALDKGVG